MRNALRIVGKIVAVTLLVAVLAYGALVVLVRPSNDREWSTDLAILPYAEFRGDLVTVHNIRNFTYKDVLDFTPGYYDKTFDLNKIRSVDFIVEPFRGLAAHTFVAFGFEGAEDGSVEYVDISVEVRREKGEYFGVIRGFLRQFELTYVVADENDVLKLRTNIRKDPVYLYPITTTKEKMRQMFVDMLVRANELRESPEFYNSLTNTCTTNIVDHVNKITLNKIPFSYKYLFPKYSDELAQEVGLIPDKGPIGEVRATHNITPLAWRYGADPLFSVKIREGR
jgi:hypothetical protein